MVLIVDFLNGYALGERAVAVRSGDGGDLVLARLEQRFCNVLSNLATCLWFWSIIKASRSGVGLFIPCTYPDDGDILDIVLEALRLVFCILLCHGIKGLRVDVNGFNGRRKIETCMRFTHNLCCRAELRAREHASSALCLLSGSPTNGINHRSLRP